MMIEIDEFDLKILRALQTDASLSVDQLAEIVVLSRNACWRRVKRLESEKIITRRVCLIEPAAVDLELLVFVMIRALGHEPEWLKKFKQAVTTMPEIIGAHRMSGDLDYVLRVRVRDVKAYDLFYQRLIEKVPIADLSASFVMEDLKNTTELPI
ncbi:MAG: Lrp/AsnC family transcriptional regulator [Pseudomonadota bacterium]